MNSKIKFGILLGFIALTVGFSGKTRNISPDEVLSLANQDRIRQGLSPLRFDPTLNLAAFAKAEDMISKKYFSHIAPDGTKPWYWFKILGYNYTYAGENLALGYQNAEELEQSWMSSPTHRANILSPDYSDVGLAIVERNNKILVVQFFGGKESKLTFVDNQK